MQLPCSFGRYQLLERLASGGMAEVFLARSFGAEGFEKRLVIKRILPELASNPRFVNLFVHEAKLSVALNHPNVVTVFDLGRVGNEPYIAMEYIHGRDLAQVQRALRREGRRMPTDMAASVVASAARGLAYAHARKGSDGRPLQIVHRDVSPHNVLMSFEGAVKIVDFGIARLEGEAADVHPGGGKYAYMSPEQAAGEPLDARSDIFSLGIVLYELLAGRRLFGDAEPEEKRRAVAACALAPMAELLPAVEPSLRAILERALQKEPAARYPDAGAMEEALRGWLFTAGWRGELQARADWLEALFPGEADARGAEELERLVDDLQALSGAVPDDAPGATQPPGSDESVETGLATDATTRNATQPVLERGERRPVAVLVAEVSGYTELSARAETEEMVRAHYRLLRAMRGVIDRLGGVAERFEDDTLTVLFGVPRATGEDVDRALACARELHRLCARLRRRGTAIELSIGVHVGELSASPVGKKLRWTARGDTHKLAVRLAWSAEPGKTLVSDRVAALAGDRFPLDRGTELRGKGARPARVTYVLAGAARVPTRNGIAGRWFRRGEEVELLRGAIAQLREGRGGRIALVGEAGMGKSRLFREFRDLARRRAVPVVHAHAAAWGADAPLSPFRDLVTDVLGLHPDAAPAEVRGRFGRLAELGLEPADIAALASLFTLETGEAAADTTTAQAGRDALVAALSRLLRGLVTDGPLVLMLEDLQYLEPLEEEILLQVLHTVEELRVVVLASWRGDLPDAFGPMFVVAPLVPLTPEQAEGMAADLLEVSGVGPDLGALVRRTSEGNPFYVEEMVKALHSAGRLYVEGGVARLRDPERDPGLPATLQGLIAARLDKLEPAARGALQVAAVLGPSFSPALLAAAVGASEPAPLIGELVRAGMIVPESRTPDTPYQFVSVLVWECVLRSILGIQRRAYHRMVAAAMEQLHADRMDTVLESFAAHAHAGGRARDAAAALLGVARAFRRAQLLDRALDACERARGWMRAAPPEQADLALEARLHVEAGELALTLARPRAERLLLAALESEGPPEVEARALLALGSCYLEQGKLPMARAHLEAASSAWRKLDDRRARVRVCEELGALALEENRIDRAQAAWEEGRALAGDDAELVARMLLATSRHALRRDDHAHAELLLREALANAERAGDRVLLGRIVNNLGVVHVFAGRFEEAIAEFRRALDARSGLGYRHGEVVNHHNIGDASFRLGDLARAWSSFEQSRELARACDWERGVAMNDVYLAYLRGLRGETVQDDLADAGARASRSGDRESALLAEAFAAALEGAERRLALALEEARRAGLSDLLRCLERDAQRRRAPPFLT